MSNAVMVAIDLLIRASLLLGVGLVTALVMHRASAASRHLVLAATLGGSLVMATLVPWAPRFELPVSWWRQVDAQGLTTVSDAIIEPTRITPSTVVTSVPTNTVTNISRVSIPLWLIVWASGTALIMGWMVWGRIGLMRIRRRAQA